MNDTDLLALLAGQMGKNRIKLAQKLKAEQETEAAKQQFSGSVLGFDADQQAAIVQLDSGGTIPCDYISSGYLKTGARVVVTIADGAKRGMIGGMPN